MKVKQGNTDLSGAKPQNPVWVSIKKSFPFIVTAFLGYAACALVAYFGVSKTFSVAAIAFEEYEVGQIADRTIVADRTLPGTMDFPVVVREGEKVIRKGFPITEDGYRKLEKMANTKEYIDYTAYGGTLIYLFLLGALWFFLFSPELLGKKVSLKEVITLVVFFALLYGITIYSKRLAFFGGASAYKEAPFIPLSLFIFLVAVIFGEKSAMYFCFVAALGILNASDYNAKLFLFVIAVGFASCRIVRKIENRMQLVVVATVTAALNVAVMFVLKVVFGDPLGADAMSLSVWLAVNGLVCGILALGLVTPLEQALNTASVFRLIDLSDLNNPIMRKMLLSASGTYNHSMMVSQLSENACKAIGANFLVARVGSYYHDIGKIEHSEYFVENQTGENKHNDLNPSLSVSIIRNHVKRGIEMARQLRLPPEVIEIIAEHHGNGVIGYFFAEAQKKDPAANPEDFSYFGDPPSSRESGVVMLADMVEAACRTLEKPTAPRLEKFINTLVEGKLQNHQLDRCLLTFADLSKIKETFVSILAGYYHSRIEYPGQKDPDTSAEAGDAK